MSAQTENKKDFSQSKLKTLWFFLAPYKLHVLALFILSLIIGVLETACVAAVYPLVSVGLDIQSGPDNIFLSAISKMAELLPIKDAFISFCVLFLLLAIIIFIVRIINTYVTVYTASHIALKTKERIFEKQMQADYQYFLDQKQGGLVYAATTAPMSLMRLINSVARLVSQALLILFIFAFLYSISWRGTIAVLLAGVGLQWNQANKGFINTRRLGQRS